MSAVEIREKRLRLMRNVGSIALDPPSPLGYPRTRVAGGGRAMLKGTNRRENTKKKRKGAIMSRPPCLAAAALALLLQALPNAQARDLSFEDRVRAQEAIERVYYAHQIGKTKPFEEAVPCAVLEQKARTYLSTFAPARISAAPESPLAMPENPGADSCGTAIAVGTIPPDYLETGLS